MADVESIVLDATNTLVTFSARWFSAVSVRGTFDRVHGVLRFREQDPESAELSLDVEAASVRTGIGLRDHHLSGRDFLNTARHPIISFRSDDVQRTNGTLLVSGTLSLCGIERRVATQCQLRPPATGAGRRESMMSLSGTVTVPRRAHLVGVPRGLRRLDPLFQVISDDVQVTVRLLVPSARLLPTLLPVPGH